MDATNIRNKVLGVWRLKEFGNEFTRDSVCESIINSLQLNRRGYHSEKSLTYSTL